MNRSGIGCCVLAVAFALACTSTGNFGLITKPSASPGELLSGSHPYKELGPVEGQACRFFLLALVPWGDATLTAAVDHALEPSGGDAILNASVASSLYGFIPIYNVLSFTCTTVKGIAIKFEQ